MERLSGNEVLRGVGHQLVPPFRVQRVEDGTPIEIDPNGKPAHEPGAKLDHGKVAAGLIHDFSLAMLAIAAIGDFGMRKYTRGGWQSVPNGEERYFDAMWRHLLKSKHEELDQDSGLPHLDHALWNLAAVIELRKRG